MKYTLIRSRRRHRSISLRITNQGEIIVRAPVFTPKLFIDHFVRGKSDWITRQLRNRPTPTSTATRYFSETALQDYINREIAHYSLRLGLSPRQTLFRQVKSYWGNCAPDGTIRFNLQLCFAPPQAVSYVVVHELVHLVHRGHGRRFWQLVTNTFPAANDMRGVLRQLSRGKTDI